ncbi:MAG: hypothetical protein GC181_06240 [Bacteroidetes bacterium]|nr:hypothetical protein [Bacteroidota bacterium]
MERKKILLVINPISGTKKNKQSVVDSFEELDPSQFDLKVYWWHKVPDLEGEINQFVEAGGWAVIAGGGDGTVHIIANSIAKTQTHLIILPMGSGDGLARQLGFSKSAKELVHQLNRNLLKPAFMDVGKMGDEYFPNVAGIGFDAHIGHVFANLDKRGLVSYAKAVLSEFRNFEEKEIDFKTGEEQRKVKAFLVSFANGTQWGNDFYIAGEASTDDGLLDVVVMKKPNIFQIPGLARALQKRRPHKLIEVFKTDKIEVQMEGTWPLHMDGEPLGSVDSASFEIIPQGIRLMKP